MNLQLHYYNLIPEFQYYQRSLVQLEEVSLSMKLHNSDQQLWKYQITTSKEKKKKKSR